MNKYTDLKWMYSSYNSVFAYAGGGRSYAIIKADCGGYALEYWAKSYDPWPNYQGVVAQDSDIFVLFKFAQEMENTCITTESSSRETPTSSG